MCEDPKSKLSGLNVTRGDTLMLYGMTKRNYSIRFEIRLDRPINPDEMRIAIDKTVKRYPYFSVTLKKNDKEYYYERNDAPVALIHTREMTRLNSEESNGHIWAVCYDEDSLFVDFYHGRSDGTGVYFLVSTLLYYYLVQQDNALDATGIRTLDTPITEGEVHDPLDDLPVVDMSSFKAPPTPPMINLMEASDLHRAQEKGVIHKLMIPEESFIAFSKENDATPGIMVCVLFARAIRRVHPDIP
ncbi:MAG: hypothetical protein Q4B54_12460, partial [Coriobacteriales bacterium]|nr:hypothetical protein [Coriobacteriales bacterium]